MRFSLAVLCTLTLAIVLSSATAHAQYRPQQQQQLAPGEDYHVEFGVAFWSPEPELVLRFDTLAGDSDIDFVEEFGIEKERFIEFRATIKPGRKHKIRIDYVPFKYDAEATIQRTFVFGGREFTIGVDAAADVEWDLWKFGYEWDFVSRTAGFAGLVIDLKYNKVSAEVSAAGLGSELEEVRAPVPGIGGIGRVYLTRDVSVTGEFTAFKILDSFSEEADGTFYDFDIYSTANIGRNVGIQAGYRSITVDYLIDDDFGNLKMKGFYLGGVLRF
jgi:hypothetical protein